MAELKCKNLSGSSDSKDMSFDLLCNRLALPKAAKQGWVTVLFYPITHRKPGVSSLPVLLTKTPILFWARFYLVEA
jgi:hypothetical protein